MDPQYSIWTDGKVIAAIISALVTIALAIWTFFSSRKNQRSLEYFKNELAEKKANNDARRDYEYEAKKRLYHEYEPLFFQLSESSINALSRIKGLARSSKQGVLNEDGWLSKDGYYLYSTFYFLFEPMAIFKLIREKINFVDLSIDPDIQFEYTLTKHLYYSFSRDFHLASQTPEIDYVATNPTMYGEEGQKNPAKYWKQGIAFGSYEQFLDSLIRIENENKRVIGFGELSDELSNKNSTIRKRFDTVKYLFLRFTPKDRPVLWRLIITQAFFHHIIIKLREQPNKAQQKDIEGFMNDFEKIYGPHLDWRSTEKDHADYSNDKVQEPIMVARQYVSQIINASCGNNLLNLKCKM